MSEPINLNRARKARARQDAATKADENAVRFGRSKAEKQAHQRDENRAGSKLDQHKLDRSDE